jgi:uncharacterized protein YijF (DUF1287 family)
MTVLAKIFSHSRWLRRRLSLLALILSLAAVCHALQTVPRSASSLTPPQQQFLNLFVTAAVERTHHTVRYDPAYVRIPYPGGDVPESTGVCTDEVIRAYRAVGVDLQKEVHEDMASHLSSYPHKWTSALPISNASATDTNIDHRRVPNLMVFFARHGQALPLSTEARDYQPGEIVAWNLGGAITHIGMVVDKISPQSGRYLIVHNIGQGPQMEDVLFNWKIIGHYRYLGGSIRN